ncbi:MAG: hypothetical protein HYZ20_18375, partial [Burkholderiales bacterium]|nr:hypothetical protein [Burkholderiales bacterium]
ALAGALRESGLTLAGGGVFDPARDSGAPGGEGRRGGAGAQDGDTAARFATAGPDPGPAPEAARIPAAEPARGLVDLYA